MRGGVVTFVTLFLAILGSEYPRQARAEKQGEKAPSWHTALGQNSADGQQDGTGLEGGRGFVSSYSSWGRQGEGDPHLALDIQAWSQGRYR